MVSLLYFVAFLGYFLRPPVVGRVSLSFFAAVASLSGLALGAQLIFQVLIVANSGAAGDSSVLALFSLERLSDAVTALRLLAPDIVVFLCTLAFLIMLHRLREGGSGSGRAGSRRHTARGEFAFRLSLALALFLAGMANASVLSLPYFLLFVALILDGAVGDDRFDKPPTAGKMLALLLTVLYCAAQLTSLHIYQFPDVNSVNGGYANWKRSLSCSATGDCC